MTTKKARHTPGPWSVVKDRFNNSQVYAENRNILDDLPIADNIIEKANASLIAAAPELLEVLKDAVPRLAELDKLLNPSLDGAIDNSAGRVLRAAWDVIAKAEGK